MPGGRPRLIDATDISWMDGAACATLPKGSTESMFYPKGEGEKFQPKIIASKEICAACPVQQDCLNWALTTDENFGTWGGMTEWERRKIRGSYMRGEQSLQVISGHGSEEKAKTCKSGKNGKMCKLCRAWYDRYGRTMFTKTCVGCDCEFKTTQSAQRFHDTRCAQINGRRIISAERRKAKKERKAKISV